MAIVKTEALSTRMMRVVLGGEALAGLVIDELACSVRLFIPWPGELFVLPEWTGNEFLLADGRRPALRTFTPVDLDLEANTITLDIVRHPGGAISDWAETTKPGDLAAISGPGRGEEIDAHATRYILLGDETAIPAIQQLIQAIPAPIEVAVHIELVSQDARLPLPESAGPREHHWHIADPAAAPCASLLAAIASTDLTDGDRIWAAGEAAGVQAIRKHLFDERGIERRRTTIRGYWKVPRPG